MSTTPQTEGAAAPAPLAQGDPTRLGRYTVLGRLGQGGMGTVYFGQADDGRHVALKVIRSDFAKNEEFRARFRREADNARRVARFCTAEVLDADPDAPQPYLVTEYIDGPTLADVVASTGPLSTANLERLAVSAAAALTAIHSAGVVHRDLKPSNVLLSQFGPRVIDFGIARALDATTGLSQDMKSMGTPAFMAPEQAQGEPVSSAADVFAWGGIVVFAATGQFPFGDGPPTVLLYRAVFESPRTDGVDESLRPIVERAMAKDPAQRPSAHELLMNLLGGGARGGDARRAVTAVLEGWDQPAADSTLARSAQRTSPVEPGQPRHPAQTPPPNQPGQPGQPGHPGQPAQPDLPGQPWAAGMPQPPVTPPPGPPPAGLAGAPAPQGQPGATMSWPGGLPATRPGPPDTPAPVGVPPSPLDTPPPPGGGQNSGGHRAGAGGGRSGPRSGRRSGPNGKAIAAGVAALAVIGLVVALLTVLRGGGSDTPDDPPGVVALKLGESVAKGQPGPGAGMISAAGEKDVYAFDVKNGHRVYLIPDDCTGPGRLSSWQWALTNPNGDQGEQQTGCTSAPEPTAALAAGRYRIVVSATSDGDTGVYGFRLVDVPGASTFPLTLGTTVRPGEPGKGAGNIESPGSQDRYTFRGSAGQKVWLKVLDCQDDATLQFAVLDPNGEDVLSSPVSCSGTSDPIELKSAGTFTLAVSGSDTDIGTYTFRLTNVPAPQVVPLNLSGDGATVGRDTPVRGAGVIDTPGAVDVYTFTAGAGQRVFFASTDCSDNASIYMSVFDQSGGKVVDENSACSEKDAIALSKGGAYRLVIHGDGDDTGSYGFRLTAVPASRLYPVAIGATIEPNANGAGRITVAGEQDRYLFSARAGQRLVIQPGECDTAGTLYYSLLDGAGQKALDSDTNSACSSSSAVTTTLTRGGPYTLVVYGYQDATGTYTLRLQG